MYLQSQIRSIDRQMNIIYKCPWTGKVILTVDIEAIRLLNGETPCPYCETVHPLPICPRETSK